MGHRDVCLLTGSLDACNQGEERPDSLKLTMPFYAITVDRKLVHPGVVAISSTARDTLFR